MAKIVLTGATGFVGSNLARRLVSEGNTVSLILRPKSSLTNIEDVLDNVTLFEYSEDIRGLCDFMIKTQPDIVFHLASLFIAEHESGNVNDLVNSNILFGTQLLEAMNKSGVKKLVNTGTSWQHFNNEKYNPVCLYAATKEAFETIIAYYHQAEGFDVITLKLFDTYGETDSRPKLINLLNKFASEKTELPMSMGEQRIDLVHIDDVVEAFLKCLELLNEHIVPYNLQFGISSGKPISLRELVSLFEQISGKKLLIKWGERPYRKREVMNPWRGYNMLQGWMPRIGLQDGLRRIIDNKNE